MVATAGETNSNNVKDNFIYLFMLYFMLIFTIKTKKNNDLLLQLTIHQ